ncbi:MAG: hypothetical protein JWQ59_1838 [Cryobacterium sp.]|jgi:hypothetical protein|nr:hypothetical protein [Cryobacterium sp.]
MRFHREGRNLAELRAQVAAEHGSKARIVAAERVTVGGIRGFFARQHFEVTVEVTTDADAAEDTRRSRRSRGGLDVPARLGIAALLAEAEETESRLHNRPVAAPVSTGSEDFAALMDDLTFNTGRSLAAPAAAPPTPAAPLAPAAPPAAPLPLGGPGDLVVVVGLSSDAVAVATSMAAAGQPGNPVDVERAGVLAQSRAAWDRRRALAARARAVERRTCLFLAYGLDAAPGPGTLAAHADAIRALGADQLWVAVDAGRKAQDTAAWVHSLAALLAVDALAVVGAAATSSPETVDNLALPVGWADGTPALPWRAKAGR